MTPPRTAKASTDRAARLERKTDAQTKRDEALAGFLDKLTEIGDRVVQLLDITIEQEQNRP